MLCIIFPDVEYKENASENVYLKNENDQNGNKISRQFLHDSSNDL